MKFIKISLILSILIVQPFGLVAADSKVNVVEITKKTAEGQIRRILEPLLDRYCREDCKILNVAVGVDVKVPENIAPGFDDIETASATIAPTSAKIKLLINEKVGPVTRSKLIDLMDQYLETLDYEVEVDPQLAKFPDPAETATKIVELKDKISKQFKTAIEDLLKQFCPKHCLLGDFTLKTEAVNAEEAQYGQPGEYHQDGGIALKIKDLSATLLLDESLSPEIQQSLLEMARLKTSQWKNVTIAGKSIRFPRTGTGRNGDDGEIYTGLDSEGSSLSERYRNQKMDSNSSSTDERNLSQNSKFDNQTHNSMDSKTSNSNEENRKEKYERYEKIERVENGDAVQKELKTFKVWGLIFGCSTIALLILLALLSMGGLGGFRKTKQDVSFEIKKAMSNEIHEEISAKSAAQPNPNLESNTDSNSNQRTAGSGRNSGVSSVSIQLQVHQLTDELLKVFIEFPKVAKHVFTRILTEEGIEVTASYIQIFGESIVLEMLRDPSLHTDLNNLIEFYSANPVDLSWDDKLGLLKKLHNRTTAGKLSVIGNRSSIHFDFLADLDSQQVYLLVQSESITAKALAMTQLEPKKRSDFYNQFDEETRTRLLGELSRIDHLPKAYIAQTADHLRRKLQTNPQLNTEALPGSDILVDLLEKTSPTNQRHLIQSIGQDLGAHSGSTLQVLKKKMISLDTLCYLDAHVALDIVLSLPHDELVKFLKTCPSDIKNAILSKSPEDLRFDLQEEIPQAQSLSREAYDLIEQKLVNRIKVMANEGVIDLYEVNSTMFKSLGVHELTKPHSTAPAPMPIPPPLRKPA